MTRRGVVVVVVGLGVLAGPLPGLPPAAGAAAAQERVKPDLDAYPKLRVQDLSAVYRDWLEHEVRWIITDVERDVFLRLDSDEKRERFISEFWRHRDPTPGTPKNEYRDLHRERVAHADRFFGRESPLRGSLTDMGQIYVLLGEPQTRNRLDSSGIVYPTEVWFYGVDARLGVPPFFYVVFFQKNGVGAYEIYSPMADGPMALLNPSGQDYVHRLAQQQARFGGSFSDPQMDAIKQALRRDHGDLAQAAFSLIPGDVVSRPTLRSELLLADVFRIPERIMDRPQWAYGVLTGSVESEVAFATLAIDTRAVGMVAEDGSSFVAYYIGTPSQGLNWTSHDDDAYLTFGVSTSLSLGTTVLDHTPKRFIESRMDPEAARRSRSEPLYFVDRVPAIPGRLSLEVVLENNVTRGFGSSTVEVAVPAAHPAVLSLGEPILAVDVEDQPYTAFAPQFPFQVGPTAFMPDVTGEVAVGGDLLVFHQLYVPRGYAHLISISYRLIDDAGVVRSRKQVAVRPDEADSFGVINRTTSVSLAGLEAGSYRVQVMLPGIDETGSTLPLRLVDKPAEPILHAERRPAPADARIVLQRAQQYRAAGELETAERLLGDVTERLPDSAVAEQLMIEVLQGEGKTERLLGFLDPRLTERPNDEALLLVMADASARMGRHHDAVRYYERARLAGRSEPRVLNALAAEYQALGDDDQARELLRLSLEADPDQPRIRALLEQMPVRSREDSRR